MIYTVGYQQHTPESMRNLLDSLQVELLIDVRSSPNSRKRGFSRKALQVYFGARYEWRGDRLGGRGKGPTVDGLDELAKEKHTVALMCMEDAPGDCHRHYQIGLPLARRGIEVRHVCGNEVTEPVELQFAIDHRGEEESFVFISLVDWCSSLG